MKSYMDLRDDVLEELKWDRGVKAEQIGVTVKDGVVTLTGTVDSYAEKLAALRAAERVAGVKAVAVEIEVKVPGVSHRSDTDIARAAEQALQWNVNVPDDQIKVKVEDGWVTLTGEVDRYDQRQAAESAVVDLTGVRGLSSVITIKPRPTTTEIKTQLVQALERSAEVDARRITVETKDGVVTLRGVVKSWAQRKEAERAAWAAPGVTEVHNRILVGL